MTNKQWVRLEPLLLPQKPKRGRSKVDHRRMVNGMLWILRTGAPWRDLPEPLWSLAQVASQFYRWQKAEVWNRVLSVLQIQAEAKGDLDWDAHLVDGSLLHS